MALKPPEYAFHERAVRLWLVCVAVLILVTVLVGGATRLTESGLSIVEWRPVTGVIPPLSEQGWQSEFQKYKAIPQYESMNRGMSLGEFKTIYWWEWTHRLLGRLIGAAFLLPLLWFVWQRWIDPRLVPRLLFVFALGALQGAVGWWMVASGLSDRIIVSQYRLATHLTLACLIYALIVATLERFRAPAVGEASWAAKTSGLVLLGLVLGQIYLGALVAGLRAGVIYNTWPLIDGGLVPSADRLWFESPAWKNLFENPLMVQFNHRTGAYLLIAGSWLHALLVLRSTSDKEARIGALALTATITAQAVLGIVTLLEVSPLPLALGHQALAMLVLTLAALHAARLNDSRRLPIGRPLAADRPVLDPRADPSAAPWVKG